MDSVISLVDKIALLSSCLLGADFVAVFYRKENNDKLIPVSFYHKPDERITELQLLEETWLQKTKGNCKIEEKFISLKETDLCDLEAEGQFAASNGFTATYQFPYYIDEEIRTVIVAYWRGSHQVRDLDIQALGHLAEILVSCMTLAVETHLVNNYSLRLWKLMRVYELPLEEYSFAEIVSKILTLCMQTIPDIGVCLQLQSSESKKLCRREVLSDQPVPEAFLDSVLQRIELFHKRSRQGIEAEEQCHDLSRYYHPDYSGVVVLEIHPHESIQGALVVWTNRIDGFSKNDLRILSVFGMFAKTEIRNALTVRRLRKARRLFEKSSMRMADIEALAALADMTAGVAHDFNNIFGGVIGRLQLMKLKVYDESILSDLSKIETLVLEGANTIKRIQEFAISAKSKDVHPVDLCRIIRDCLDIEDVDWKNLASAKKVAVISRLAVDEAIINGSETDLKTVIHKLLKNAMEYSPENSTVEVILNVDDRHFTISVVDNGPGIPEEIKQKIFYPFFSTKGTPGAGLGLAIVHGIVTRQGGKVSIKTNKNSGTVFNVTFLRAAQNQDISEITSKTKSPGPLKILVVDDDEQIREILIDMLTMYGYNAIACPDAYAALKAIEDERFDILITDLGMPGMSGLDLAAEVHQTHPQIPIAMITGWGTQLSEQEISSRGINAVLSKPFHLKEIKTLVYELAQN